VSAASQDVRAARRVSIVTISYNQQRFLDECLDSVLSQDVAGLEFIVVDPGSTDGSREIIARRRARLDAVILEPDDGPADGLNKGFRRATGDILGYVNSDDRLAPGALGYVIAYFDRHPEVDVLCSAIRIIDQNGRAEFRRRTPDRFDLRAYAAGVCTVGQQATFIRRRAFEAVGGFNPQNRICWDGELLVDLALAGARFATTDRVLGDFRIYPESMTGSGMFRSERYLREHARIADKVRARGIRVDKGFALFLRRLRYKASASRHLRYVLAR
jgi:glycosyltransferase involved in cell wall biosynthesis